MEKTNALINHLNLSEDERNAFAMVAADGRQLTGVEAWSQQAGALFSEAYREAVFQNNNPQGFLDQIAAGLPAEAQVDVLTSFIALNNIDTTPLQTRLQGADNAQAQAQVRQQFVAEIMEQEAMSLTTRLRDRARAQVQPAPALEEEGVDASLPAAPAATTSGGETRRRQDGDDGTDLVNQLEGQRAAVQPAQPAEAAADNTAGAPTAPAIATVPANVPSVSATPEGVEAVSYMQDMLTRLNETVGAAAKADPNNPYVGQSMRPAAELGFTNESFQGMSNFRSNTETLIATATPQEMQNFMEDQIANDLINGNFPFEYEFSNTSPEGRAAEAATFARNFTQQLKSDGFFEKHASAIYSGTYNRQSIGFYPSEEGFQRAADIMLSHSEIRGPDITTDNNLGAEFFTTVINDQMRERYSSPERMTEYLQDRYRDMVRDGDISVYGRANSQQSLSALDEVIERVTEKMRAGTVSGGSFIDSNGWNEQEYARLMREEMALANITFEQGVGPASRPTPHLAVNEALDSNLVSVGQPVRMQLGNTNFDVSDVPAGADAENQRPQTLFTFDRDIEIFKIEDGGESGPVLTQIYETTDGQDLGTNIDPAEFRALMGDQGFTLAPVYNDGDLLAYRIETGSGNAFYISQDAIEDGSMTSTFSQNMQQAALDAAVQDQQRAAVGAPAVGIGGRPT